MNFTYHAPVALHVGHDCIAQNAEQICSYGRKAFLLTGSFAPGYPNLAVADLRRVFHKHNIDFEISYQVEENPTVESVKKITESIREYSPDFIVSVGGGSALDSAKAANVLLSYPADCNAYEVFYSGELDKHGSTNRGTLPMIGIPTTAGSGSEVAGYAILTRTDTHTKLRMNQLSFFDVAFLDARYIINSPPWLLDTGPLDALAHGIESYLNVSSNPTNQMLCEAGFRLFKDFKDNLLQQKLTENDCEKMLLAAALQGMAVVQASTTLPHGMGYPLTHYKNVSHGFASCFTMAFYLKNFKNDQKITHILNLCGFTDINSFSDYIMAIISRNIDISITKQEILQWTNDFYKLKNRLSRHPEPITEEEIFQIYLDSYDAYTRSKLFNT